MEIEIVLAEALSEALTFLETIVRDGAPVPEAFAAELRASVERGGTEVFVARLDGRVVGAALLDYRLNVSVGGFFASIEEVQVGPDARRRGVGRALIEAAVRRCAGRGVSYIEVQTDDEAADFYIACGFEPEPGVRVLSRSVSFDEASTLEPRSL